MNASEAALLLGVCAAYDRRTVGEVDAMAWAEALHDVPLDDAKTAVVQHYRNSRDWVMPSDVRKLVKAIREERLAREIVPAPNPDAVDSRDYKAELQRNIARIASGWNINNALEAPKADPNETYNEARGGDRDPLRVSAIRVPCPWPPCQAPRGSGCVDAQGRRLSIPAHEARLKAASLLNSEASS